VKRAYIPLDTLDNDTDNDGRPDTAVLWHYHPKFDINFDKQVGDSDVSYVNSQMNQLLDLENIRAGLFTGEVVQLTWPDRWTAPIRAVNPAMLSKFIGTRMSYGWLHGTRKPYCATQPFYECAQYATDLTTATYKVLGYGIVFHTTSNAGGGLSHAYNACFLGGDWHNLKNWRLIEPQEGSIFDPSLGTTNPKYNTDSIYLYGSIGSVGQIVAHSLNVNGMAVTYGGIMTFSLSGLVESLPKSGFDVHLGEEYVAPTEIATPAETMVPITPMEARMKGLDYSRSRPDPKKVKALLYGFVARYLYLPAPGGKGITKAEAEAIRAAGLGLVVVYESYAGRAKEGLAAGVEDGKTALTYARSIGFPDSRPLYFAVDFQPTTVELVFVDAYLKGVASVIGLARVGVYGSYAVVEHCHAIGTARWFWQTYAWSGGKVSAHTHFLQYLNGQTVAGASVDLNENRQFDFGAWDPPVTVKPVVVAKPVVKPVFHLMTPAELLAMVKGTPVVVKPATPAPVIKPAVAVPVTKPAIHIMSPAEMLAWMKNLMKK
jgi:hypothetical protein